MEVPDIYGTGRIASPFQSPDKKAFALYHDGITTLWYYSGTNQIVVQTTAPESERPAIKRRILEKLKSAIAASHDIMRRAEDAIKMANNSIERARKAIDQNTKDVVAFNTAIMSLDQQWPDEECFDAGF